MARCVVKVIGMGDRVTGTNRTTGKPYDFRKVAFAFTNPWGSGDVSVNMIDGVTLDELNVQVDKCYAAVVNQVKNVYYIDLIDPVDSL